jgi:hypothetical protein
LVNKKTFTSRDLFSFHTKKSFLKFTLSFLIQCWTLRNLFLHSTLPASKIPYLFKSGKVECKNRLRSDQHCMRKEKVNLRNDFFVWNENKFTWSENFHLCQNEIQSNHGPMAQRITRLPTEQKIPGSNPGWIANNQEWYFFLSFF